MREAGAAMDLDEEAHHRLRLELAGISFRPLVPPSDHHVLLRGMRFHYVEWGSKDAPALLFLHGGGQTCRTWDIVCHELSRDYRCIALDLRGHGDSEWSYELDYRLEAHAGDAAALLDALGSLPVVAIGMSLGAMSALFLALTRPDCVQGVVAVDAGPWVQVVEAEPIRAFMHEVSTLDALDQFIAAAIRFNPRRDVRLLRRSLLHNLRRRPDGRLMWKSDPRPRDDRPRGMEAALTTLQKTMGDLIVPALVVRGGESRILREEDALRFARTVPDGRLVTIAGAGHNVQGDQPKALTEALAGFLAGIGFGATAR